MMVNVWVLVSMVAGAFVTPVMLFLLVKKVRNAFGLYKKDEV